MLKSRQSMSTKSRFQLSCSHPQNTVYLSIGGNKKAWLRARDNRLYSRVSLIVLARNLAWLTANSLPRIEIFIVRFSVTSDYWIAWLASPEPNGSRTCHKHKSTNCEFRRALTAGFDTTPSGAQEPDESLDNKSGVFATRP